MIVCAIANVAFGGDKKCGVECDTNNANKYLVCSEIGQLKVSKYLCTNGSWQVFEGTLTAGRCKEDGTAPNEDYRAYCNWNVDYGSRLYVKKNLQPNGSGYLVDEPDFTENADICVGCRPGYVDDANERKCVKAGGVQIANPCPEGKNVNDECLSGNPDAPKHATKARCRWLQRKSNEAEQLTCAATECADNYLLYLDANGKSQGVCHSVDYATDYCAKENGKNCKPTCSGSQQCVPWIVDTPNNLKIKGQTLVPKKDGAYGCHCADNNANNSGNGNNAGNTGNNSNGESGENGNDAENTGDNSNGGNGGGLANVSLENAKTTISKFFADAKSNRSVWKTAEGKFNTARLASDLTAGVVLGTVGGVVSGVVIKKKQVEKGFDALHCAVGGQTIADWGDTFTVGLR